MVEDIDGETIEENLGEIVPGLVRVGVRKHCNALTFYLRRKLTMRVELL